VSVQVLFSLFFVLIFPRVYSLVLHADQICIAQTGARSVLSYFEPQKIF